MGIEMIWNRCLNPMTGCLTAKLGAFRRTFILMALCLSIHSCGDQSPAPPSVPVGSLRITVEDDTSVDSITVVIDGQSFGKGANPCVVENIPVGTHDLVVIDGERVSPVKKVEVFPGRETNVSVSFVIIGPYVGEVAPDFSVISARSEPIRLREWRGKVVLLAFFGSCSGEG